MRRMFVAGLLMVLAGGAAAAPQSIGDCEKIADPDAYNRCLAAFGPPARTRGTAVPATQAPAPVASEEKPAVRSRAYRGKGRYTTRSSRGGKYTARGRHGRVRMTFTPGGGSRGKAKRYRGRRR